ncbi:cystatin Pr17a-like isoform X2 [Rhodnius prolixus]
MIGASVFDILGDTTRIENLEDKNLKRTVANVVSTQKSNMEIIRITSGKIQVGHGKKYIIKFIGRVRPSNEWQFYYLSYVLRPWLSDNPQDVEFKPLPYGKSRNFK